MACLVFYIGYLYIQNPLVVTRLGGVIMGKNPGIPEKIISGRGIPIGTILEESLISQDALNKSINFAKENDSHALLVFHQDNLEYPLHMIHKHILILVDNYLYMR